MVIIAKSSPQDAQRHARAFASKNNNSKEHQKTETESQDRKDNKARNARTTRPPKSINDALELPTERM